MALTRKVVFPALIGLAVYYALFGGEYSVFEVRKARAEREVAEAQLVELRSEIDALRARVEALETDPATLERLAREKFGMIRDGELLYRMVPPAEGAESGAEEPVEGS